jgi:murein DD-endopeptidase MepM/ murein hydrolase activator NlpD
MLRVGGLFAVLLGINVYVFFIRDGGNVRELMQSGSISKTNAEQRARKKSNASAQVGLSASPTTEKSNASSGAEVILRGTMRGHSGLFSALTASGLEKKSASSVIRALAGKLDMRSLRPRHRFEIRLESGSRRLRRFVYHLSRIKRAEVAPSAKGALVGKIVELPVRIQKRRIGGRVGGSLNQSFAKTGESVILLYRLLRIFGADINWSTDVRSGDTFKLITEKRYLEGKLLGYGRILAAEYRGEKAGHVRAFYFKRRDGSGGYYSADGRSLKRVLLKTPLNYRRISSRFNRRRFHPILHRVKAHLGVDYAAPAGTPIWAAGDGTVIWAKRGGPAGKMVQIRHAHNLTTVYMHLSRYARGMKVGRKVKQYQVIGYVGSTGRSTGPHLHYGLKVRGRYVDSMSYPIPRGKALARRERVRFQRQVARLKSGLASTPISTDDARKKAEDDKKDDAAKSETPLDDDMWT